METIEIHEGELQPKYFIKDHIYDHVFKKHIPRIFLWVFFNLLAVEYLMAVLNLESIIAATPRFVLILLAAWLASSLSQVRTYSLLYCIQED